MGTVSGTEDIEVWVRRSREAQGLPAKVTDPATLARLAALFTHVGHTVATSDTAA